jgi:hypothetical protein
LAAFWAAGGAPLGSPILFLGKFEQNFEMKRGINFEMTGWRSSADAACSARFPC